MKPRIKLHSIIILALWLGACQGTTVPERRDLLGTWSTEELPGVVIRMTLAETARSVDGAGSWLGPDQALAFRVSGAVARDELSLFLDFNGLEAMNFQGRFQSADVLQGRLNGRGFRDHSVSFTRSNPNP
jgi:hypothetical protein